MSSTPQPKPTFSKSRKWNLGFHAILAAIMVLAVLVMLNYLSGRYFKRFYLSTLTRVELSSRTLHFLRSLTNQVQVTLYYDKTEPLYGDIAELLKEYRANNAGILVQTVDYTRDPAAAEELKVKYDLGASTNKDLVIFDCSGKFKILPGGALAEYTLEPVPNSTEREFRRKPVYFKGEVMFTAALLAVTNPKPLKACFLQGHGEHQLDDGTDQMGYLKFASVLRQNHIQVQPLELLTNDVPEDCNLLVIAGPKDPIPEIELKRIEQYVDEGGRLFVLFNFLSVDRQTGLEPLLGKWGIHVSTNIIKEPRLTRLTVAGSDVIISDFRNNPAVNPLLGSRLHLLLPRVIQRADATPPNAEAIQVQEIAFSSPESFLRNESETLHQRKAHPLMAAMDSNPVKGVGTSRGSTRMLVTGDSIFLGNHQIESAANRDFVSLAANWLLDRTLLLEGLGPRPVLEYRLLVTRNQQQALHWILLGGIPGGILLLGSLVWLRRRS